MSKIILFSRVSTSGQDLTQQTNALKFEANRLGYDESQQITIEYKESGISLDTDERQGIQELYQTIENDSEIDSVLVYEISRLGRRSKTLFEVRDWLIQRKVNLHCITPSITMLDSNGNITRDSVLMFGIFSSISESEMMIKKERMMRGRIAKRERCEFIGGNVLFGYTYDDKDRIYIDNNSAQVVKRIFQLYIDGMSLRQIAKEFVDSGKIPYNDYPTAEVMLRRMIRRSEYAGIKQNTYDYPPIIDIETWNKVRERAEKRNKYKTRTKGIYFCQGKIVDKTTRHSLSPNYLMSNYRTWDEHTNHGYTINMNMIDSLVWYTVKKHFDSIKDKRKDKMIFDLNQRKFTIHDKIIKGRDRLKMVEQQMDRINIRIVQGKLREQLGDKMLEDSRKERNTIRMEMLRWNSEESQINLQLSNIELYSEMNFDVMNEQEIATFIREHVEIIEILPIYRNDKMTKDRKIWITMKDGVRYRYDSTKRGNYFHIYWQDKHGNIRKELEDFEIVTRYKRKWSSYTT